MAKGSGSTRGKAGTADNGGDYKGTIKNVETLKNIKNAKLYNDMKEAISRYHSALGVRQREVKLADLGGNVYGVHVTADGNSEAVYLNKKYFKNATSQAVAATHAANYKTGWSTQTNKPVMHTITHELAHATWNNALTGANQKAAGKEITALYRQWKDDKNKKGYGKYARTNVNEFWSETVTKAIHGTSDKYTKAVKDIAKKYKL